MRQGQHMGNRCQPLWQRIPQPLPQRDQRQEMPLGAAVWQVIDVRHLQIRRGQHKIRQRGGHRRDRLDRRIGKTFGPDRVRRLGNGTPRRPFGRNGGKGQFGKTGIG